MLQLFLVSVIFILFCIRGLKMKLIIYRETDLTKILLRF